MALSATSLLRRAVATVALIALGSGTAAADNELSQFFPSVRIHEDDRLRANFEVMISGCDVEFIEASRYHLSIGRFDVRDFETDPERAARQYPEQLSTRYNVAWFAVDELIDTSIESLGAALHELRISGPEFRTLSPSELQDRSDELESILLEIRSGNHGTFAQSNHTARYRETNDGRLLVAVYINMGMQFPVAASDMEMLLQTLHHHSLECI